jgi:hypothetical protein
MSDRSLKIVPTEREDHCVELRGFEPLTFCMPRMPISSEAIGLGRITAGRRDSGVRARRAPSAVA